MAASFRATATLAFDMQRRLAIFMPHARRADHFLLQKRMACFVERRACQLVAASADPALDVCCAGLIESWGQTQVSADIPRFAEPLRLINRGSEGQGGHGTDTRSAHQLPADRLVPHDVENLFGQPRELAQHHAENCEQRLSAKSGGVER
jgi:hypothetical protein